MTTSRERFKQAHGALAQQEREAHEGKIRELEAKLKKERDARITAEEIRSAVFGLSEQKLDAPQIILPRTEKKNRTTLVPVLLISDEQVGEHIVAEEVEGVNFYDHNVYAERHDRCARTLVEISSNHMGAAQFPLLVAAFLGDAVNGQIHAELAETNTLHSIPSVRKVVAKRRDAIDFWLSAKNKDGGLLFPKIIVIVIPGNHGRTTIKPRFKRYVSTNYEAIIGWWLQEIYAKEPRVKIVVPESGDYHMMIWGRGLFFTHGDRMGSLTGKGAGMGFAGPVLPILRGAKQIREQQGAMGRRIDYIHVGHWHDQCDAGGAFGNGAMAGYNEFAHGLRYRPAPAVQTLYYLHAEYGATARWPIFLSEQPRAAASPDVFDLA